MIDIAAIRQALRNRHRQRQQRITYRAEWYNRYSRQWIPHRRHDSLNRAIRAAQSFSAILLHDVPYRVVNIRTGLTVWQRTE